MTDRNKIIELLKAAKTTISDPKNWIKGTFSANEYDVPVFDIDPSACKWCAAGAVRHHFYKNDKFMKIYNVHYDAIRELNNSLERYNDIIDIVEFNDAEKTTHEDVMKLFDRTIHRMTDKFVNECQNLLKL